MSNINAKFVIFKLFATAKKLIKFRNCQYFCNKYDIDVCKLQFQGIYFG